MVRIHPYPIFFYKLKYKLIYITKYKDINELRQKAIDYYKNNFQGKTIVHPELGEIKFSGKGIRKTINSSADDTKLKFLPKLAEIILLGEIGELEIPKKSRKDDITGFIFIKTPIVFNGNHKTVIVNIAQEKNSYSFYNINYKTNS